MTSPSPRGRHLSIGASGVRCPSCGRGVSLGASFVCSREGGGSCAAVGRNGRRLWPSQRDSAGDRDGGLSRAVHSDKSFSLAQRVCGVLFPSLQCWAVSVPMGTAGRRCPELAPSAREGAGSRLTQELLPEGASRHWALLAGSALLGLVEVVLLAPGLSVATHGATGPPVQTVLTVTPAWYFPALAGAVFQAAVLWNTQKPRQGQDGAVSPAHPGSQAKPSGPGSGLPVLALRVYGYCWDKDRGTHGGTVGQSNPTPAFRVRDRAVVLSSNEVCLGEKKRGPHVQRVQGTRSHGVWEQGRGRCLFTGA